MLDINQEQHSNMSTDKVADTEQCKKTILYLHGFLSSNQSAKAVETINYVKEHHSDIDIIAPLLPSTPDEVVKLLNVLLKQYRKSLIGFIGSSLGGYFATWCAAKKSKPAVLINPAVKPYALLDDYMGWHQNPYTKDEFEVTADFKQKIKSLEVESVAELKILALLQTKDETLDYKEAEAKFAANELEVIEGGNHAFEHYSDYLPQIIKFLNSSTC